MANVPTLQSFGALRPPTHQLPALEPQIPLPPHANVGALPSATYAYHLARPLSGARPSSRGAQGQDDARSGHHLRQDGRGDSSATMTPQQQGARQPTAVYALILASLAMFLVDNILHMPAFRSFYLHHSSWRWYQPLTAC